MNYKVGRSHIHTTKHTIYLYLHTLIYIKHFSRKRRNTACYEESSLEKDAKGLKENVVKTGVNQCLNRIYSAYYAKVKLSCPFTILIVTEHTQYNDDDQISGFRD